MLVLVLVLLFVIFVIAIDIVSVIVIVPALLSVFYVSRSFSFCFHYATRQLDVLSGAGLSPGGGGGA